MTELRAEALVADACAATGLDDFGTDSFRDGLTALCDSLNSDAQWAPAIAVCLASFIRTSV